MSRYLVSVGGSGQHIALAATRLVYMGMLKPTRLVAIDPDNGSALSQLLTEPAGMRGAHHPLQDGRVFAPFDPERVGQAPFERMFVNPAGPVEANDLFEAMFDQEAADIPIHKGMYGTPSVGATVFAEGVNSQGLQQLLEPMRHASEIYVCGSMVGGTGAGLIHKLIREIRKYYSRDMFGVFMLPWFRIGQGPTQKGGITDATIQRNSMHGIKYFFEHTIPELQASLLIGYPGTQSFNVLRPLQVDQGDMGEHPHFLHLAAAWGLVKLQAAHTANKNIRTYGVAHDASNETWLLDDVWEHANGATLRAALRAHRVAGALVDFLLEKQDEITSYYDAKWAPFRTPDPWGDLHPSITNNAPARQTGPYSKQLMDEFRQIKAELDFCIRWAERLFPGSIADWPNDDLMTRLRQGTTASAKAPTYWEVLRGYWRGRPMPKNPNGVTPASEVARHHYKLILEGASRIP
jgi:hypothetical protein